MNFLTREKLSVSLFQTVLSRKYLHQPNTVEYAYVYIISQPILDSFHRVSANFKSKCLFGMLSKPLNIAADIVAKQVRESATK
jgi:hypothetical protein